MTVVVDASAVMALMLDEPGADVVIEVIRGSFMSTVNVSECCARGVERGAGPEDVLAIIASYDVETVAFDLTGALDAARLRRPTRQVGASLGDRAFLSLAERRRLPAFTADRRLATLASPLGLDIRLIR